MCHEIDSSEHPRAPEIKCGCDTEPPDDTETTDFQLEFYYLLASGLGNVVGCGYYDLKESKIVKEVFLQEKLAVLESNIKDLLNQQEINFELCEDAKNCLFCDYKTICGR